MRSGETTQIPMKLAVKTCKNSPLRILEVVSHSGLLSQNIMDHFDLKEEEGYLCALIPELLEHNSQSTLALKMFGIDLLITILCSRTWEGKKFYERLGRDLPEHNQKSRSFKREEEGREGREKQLAGRI